MGKEKPVLQISSSSNQGNNNNGNIGISFIAPDPVKKSNPSEYKISSSSQNTFQGTGISFIAPEKKKQEFSVSSRPASISFIGTGVPSNKGVRTGKHKHYEMEFDSKYKKSDPKTYQIVKKVNDLYFEAKRPTMTRAQLIDYIIQQSQQPQRTPNMSFKQFFNKKGHRRRRGRK